jgi:7-cyano-7-deazaguanine synthase
VVLLSGGMDSATCLAEAVRKGPVYALTVEYGQRHAREIESARQLARFFGAKRHVVLDVPLDRVVRSALTDRARKLPVGRSRRSIPSTYVPARNTFLLALGLAYAESVGVRSLYLGANAIDYSGYPDCRPPFLRAFERLSRLATRAGVEDGTRYRVRAPLLRLSKAEIVRRGERLGVPWQLTWSCYAGGRRPCGRCDACRLRAKGFHEAGRADPHIGRDAGRASSVPGSRGRSPAPPRGGRSRRASGQDRGPKRARARPTA